MADWPLSGDGQRYKEYFNPAGTAPTGSIDLYGVSFPATASAHVKQTTWTTLVTSLEFDAVGVYVTLHSAAQRLLLDIGVGATPSVVIGNIAFECSNATYGHAQIYFPIAFKAGDVISGAAQTGVAGVSVRVSLMFVGGGFDAAVPGTLVSTHGAVAAATLGTAVDPGTSGNSYGGATVFLGGVTTYPIRYLTVFIGPNGRLNQGSGSNSWVLDIIVNGIVILPNLLYRVHTTPDVAMQCYYGPYAVQIPGAVQLSARVRSNVVSTSRHVTVVVYGVS
jgi:hypothetical protein